LHQVLVELFKCCVIFLPGEIRNWDAVRVLYHEILYLVVDYHDISEGPRPPLGEYAEILYRIELFLKGHAYTVVFCEAVLEEGLLPFDGIDGSIRIVRVAAREDQELKVLHELPQHASHVWPELDVHLKCKVVSNLRKATRNDAYLHLIVLVSVDVECEAHVGVGKRGPLPLHPHKCFIHVKDYCALV
jgi:hypothetical protein